MNKLIAFLLFSTLIFFSCQKDKSEKEEKPSEELSNTFDSTALQTTKLDSDANESFSLNYKFVPGESFKYRLTVISKNEQSIQADSSINALLDQTLTYIIDFKTLSIDDDSIAELQCTFSSVNLKANANGNEITYKSGSQVDSTDKSKFAEYESIINNPFNLRIGKNGELIEIYKIDKVLNRFMSLRGLPDTLNVEDKAAIKNDISNRSIRPLLSQIFREVPDHKMTKDSSWTFKRESMRVMIFEIDYTNIYKIENVEMLGNDRIAIIDGTMKTKIRGDESYSERGVNYKFNKPTSNASGKIYFNIDRGLIQKSRTQTTMKNSYSMEMPTPQGTKKGKSIESISNVNVLELL